MMELQARLWYEQRRFEEAKSEVLRAIEAFEEIGAVDDLEGCKEFLRQIEGEID